MQKSWNRVWNWLSPLFTTREGKIGGFAILLVLLERARDLEFMLQYKEPIIKILASIDSFLRSGLGFGLVFLLGVILIVRGSQKPKPAAKSVEAHAVVQAIPSVSMVVQRDPQMIEDAAKWHKVEKHQSDNLGALVIVLRKEIELNHLQASEPFIDFLFVCANFSIFLVYFGKIDGRVLWQGEEFANVPEIREPEGNTRFPPLFQPLKLRLRQRMTLETAKKMAGTDKPMVFDFSRVNVWIEAEDAPINAPRHRIMLGNEAFQR